MKSPPSERGARYGEVGEIVSATVHRATNVLDRWGGFAPLVRHEATGKFWSAFIHHETS